MPSYLVTGASRGLGLEFIAQLSANKENTVFAMVRAPSSQLEELIRKTGRSNVHTLYADIVDHAALKKAAEEVSKITGGTLDVLICNAALLHHKDNNKLLNQYVDEEDALQENLTAFFTVNVIGTLHTITAFLPLLTSSSSSSSPTGISPLKKVIVITSKVGDVSWTVKSQNPSAPGYGISKAAVNLALAKLSSVPEYKERGVVFVGISPGLVKTMVPSGELTENQIDALYDNIVQNIRRSHPTFEGTVTAEESCRRMLDTIEKANFEMNGLSFGQDGEPLSE